MAPLQYAFPERTTLSRRDRVVVRAIAEAMFAGEPISAARLDDHVEEVDVLISAASKTLRFGLRMMLLLVRFSPIVMFFRARTIEKLTIDDRVRLLDRLERSKLLALSLAFVGWRTVMTILFYEDPRELAAIGYSEARTRRALPMVPIPAESGVRLGDGLEANREIGHPSVPREVA